MTYFQKNKNQKEVVLQFCVLLTSFTSHFLSHTGNSLLINSKKKKNKPPHIEIKKKSALELVSHASKAGRSFFQETNRSVKHGATHFYNSHQEPSCPDKPSLCSLRGSSQCRPPACDEPKRIGGWRGKGTRRVTLLNNFCKVTHPFTDSINISAPASWAAAPALGTVRECFVPEMGKGGRRGNNPSVCM